MTNEQSILRGLPGHNAQTHIGQCEGADVCHIAVLGYNKIMEKYGGRFKSGERRSIATEFKKGTHWRKAKPFRDKEWLIENYIVRQRSSGDIGKEFGVTEAAIIFWLRKHGIPRRSISQARAIKHWGQVGEDNPMFGKRGSEVPNWKGGVSPERAACYSSIEWAEASKVVWTRDAGKCKRCSAKANNGMKMHIHHVVSFANKELRTDPDNLVLLCIDCHHFVHSRKNSGKEFL